MRRKLLSSAASLVRGFFVFWYRFIIGDDWIGAAVIAAGVAGTSALARRGLNAFWLIPLALLTSVTISLFRVKSGRIKR